MVHQRWNKSGQGMPTKDQVGRIHCNWDAADAKGTWDDFMKNNIGYYDGSLESTKLSDHHFTFFGQNK